MIHRKFYFLKFRCDRDKQRLQKNIGKPFFRQFDVGKQNGKNYFTMLKTREVVRQEDYKVEIPAPVLFTRLEYIFIYIHTFNVHGYLNMSRKKLGHRG